MTVAHADREASTTRFDANSLRLRRAVPRLATLFGLAFVAGGWRIGLAPLDDNSFLWHFRTGRLILDDGIPHRDVYSYTVPGARWIAQSWLAESMYALADRVAGPVGIRLLVGSLGGLLAWLVWRIALEGAGDRLRAAGVGLVALVVTLNVFGERPLSFGLVGMAALVIAVEHPRARIARHPMIVLPVLFWLWGNTHGSMSLGYAYLGLHLAGRWFEGASPFRAGRERTLLVASLLSVCLLVANPYGIALLFFPFELVSRGDVLADVVEWMSPNFRTPLGMAYAAWIALVVCTAARGRQRPGRRDVVVAIPFLLLGLWAQRNVGIAALATLPIVARSVRAPTRAEDGNPRFARACLALVAGLVILFGAVAVTEPDFDLRGYPVAAMQFIDDEGRIGERIFTSDRAGGFVIAKYWPRQTVFLDDRFDMYPGEVVAEYDTVAKVEPGWDTVLEERGVTLVVWEKDRALASILAERADWEQIYVDETFVVFGRIA